MDGILQKYKKKNALSSHNFNKNDIFMITN